MSAITTFAPASARAVAMPSPMPEAAPVTIAVLPEMWFIAMSLSTFVDGLRFGKGSGPGRKRSERNGGDWIVGVVGPLQLDVLTARFTAEIRPPSQARWCALPGGAVARRRR